MFNNSEIKKERGKVIKRNKFLKVKKNNIKDTIIEAIQNKKGSSICCIDLSKIPTAPASGFIICQGKTPTQTTAIADEIIDKTREINNQKSFSIDGMRNGQWIIIDYGETMVHIFTPDFREFYNLEDLWADGKIEKIEDLD